MNKIRDLWAICSDIEKVITDLLNTRDFQARYSNIFDVVDKTDYQKVYDYDTAAIMERVLFDRLYDEVTELEKLYNELHTALWQNKNNEEQTAAPLQ